MRLKKIFLGLLLIHFTAAFIAAEDAPAAQAAPAPSAAPQGRTRRPLPEPANPKLPSLILIGDSTVRNGQDDGQNKGDEGQWGWGNPIAADFDPAKINVVNRAVGGLSSRTYLTGGYWEKTLAFVKPGDFVVMQFGHNDGTGPGPVFQARASLRGAGDESEERDNPVSKQKETVHTYGWYLRKYIRDAKEKGAIPIVCSLIPRKQWDDAGKIKRDTTYAIWAKQVAAEEHVGFIDLNTAICDRYDALGHDAVMKLFPQVTPDEHTHTNMPGAKLNAEIVVSGLRKLSGDPFAPYLSEKGQTVKP